MKASSKGRPPCQRNTLYTVDRKLRAPTVRDSVQRLSLPAPISAGRDLTPFGRSRTLADHVRAPHGHPHRATWGLTRPCITLEHPGQHPLDSSPRNTHARRRRCRAGHVPRGPDRRPNAAGLAVCNCAAGAIVQVSRVYRTTTPGVTADTKKPQKAMITPTTEALVLSQWGMINN